MVFPDHRVPQMTLNSQLWEKIFRFRYVRSPFLLTLKVDFSYV
jgi:hypothetical protein